MTPLSDWADALYLGARTMWPDLTWEQFIEACEASETHRPVSVPTLVDTVRGVVAELRARYGDPVEGDA